MCLLKENTFYLKIIYLFSFVWLWVVTLEPGEALTKAGNPDWEQPKPPRLPEAGLTAALNYSSSDMDSNPGEEQRRQMRTRGKLQDSELTPGLLCFLSHQSHGAARGRYSVPGPHNEQWEENPTQMDQILQSR